MDDERKDDLIEDNGVADENAMQEDVAEGHSDYKPVNRFDASVVHHLSGMYQSWFLDYASYVILERAAVRNHELAIIYFGFVLIEEHRDNYATGYTDNYIRVYIEDENTQLLPGTFLNVKLTDIYQDGCLAELLC